MGAIYNGTKHSICNRMFAVIHPQLLDDFDILCIVKKFVKQCDISCNLQLFYIGVTLEGRVTHQCPFNWRAE